MITEQHLISAIEGREQAIMESCNSHHINHVQGVIRGLVWALIGEDPGVIDDSEQLRKLIDQKTPPR